MTKEQQMVKINRRLRSNAPISLSSGPIMAAVADSQHFDLLLFLLAAQNTKKHEQSFHLSSYRNCNQLTLSHILKDTLMRTV